MSKVSKPRFPQNKNKQLQLKFFVANKNRVIYTIIYKKDSQDQTTIQLLKKKATYQIIDTSLLDYKHHYLKDLQTHFPEDQIVCLLYSPKISYHDMIQIKTVSQWRQTKALYPKVDLYWFPFFYNHNSPQQHLFEQTQLLVIIIEKNGKFYGFIGYTAKSFIIYNILEILMNFYGINMTKETVYFTKQSNQFNQINKLKNISVGQAQGMCIKVCTISYSLPNLDQNRENKKQRGRQHSEILDFNEFSLVNRQIESELTNHAPRSQNWQQAMELQTSLEQKNEFRNKLITYKSIQQIEKIKNRGKLNVQPKISVPGQSEIKIMDSLKTIIEQLQFNLKIN